MKYTVMRCEICGKRFCKEYDQGGYIDHTNMTFNKGCYGQDVEEDVEMICVGSESIRSKDDAMSRLNCYQKWDHISDKHKAQVRKESLDFLSKYEKLMSDVGNKYEKLTSLEQMALAAYIGEMDEPTPYDLFFEIRDGGKHEQ